MPDSEIESRLDALEIRVTVAEAMADAFLIGAIGERPDWTHRLHLIREQVLQGIDALLDPAVREALRIPAEERLQGLETALICWSDKRRSEKGGLAGE